MKGWRQTRSRSSRRPPATWFREVFADPTAAQAGAWNAISAGENALVIAPTGSGKTLAAFLWALDGLTRAERPPVKQRCRVLYVSPLKALAVDVERNLRAPLAGITRTALRLGQTPPSVTVGVRSGDTSPAERRKLVTQPPDILITTPESLFLILTSAARDTLRNVHTVIVDEVHALAGTKRGAHLALSLERLDALVAESRNSTIATTDPARRSVGHGSPAGAGRRLPRRSASGHDRGAAGREVVGPVDRRAGRGHERSGGHGLGARRSELDRSRRRPGPGGCATEPPVDLAPRGEPDPRPDQLPTAPRSCSPIPAGWPSG